MDKSKDVKSLNVSKVKLAIILCAIIGSFIIYFDTHSGKSISIEDTSLNKEFIPVIFQKLIMEMRGIA